MKQEIKTYLPVFSGFYGTIFEADEEMEISGINYERQAKGLEPINYDSCEFDYAEYHLGVAKEATNYIEKELKSLFGKNFKCEMESLVSPKEYNFQNDSVNVVMTINKAIVGKIRKYLNDNFMEFSKYISSNYTSCDGFMSSFDNSSYVWVNEYLNDLDGNGHYLGSILNFILSNEGIEDINIHEKIETSIYAKNYSELVGE